MDLRSIRFIQEIRYFTAAYEEGNFTRAAKREHCTQSGLSTHIKCLESILSQQLFVRNARGVTPTIAGRCLYECSTNILRSVKAARQRMVELAGGVGGSLDIGVPLSFGRSVLPTVLQLYLSSHPFVEVRMTEGLSDNIAALVGTGDLQVAIVTEPPASFGLETTLFFSDQVVMAMAPKQGNGNARSSHAKSKRDKLAERRTLPRGSYKLVLSSKKHGSRRAIESRVRLDALASGNILEIDGLEARLELVRTSDWVTLIPAFAIAKDVKEGRLHAEPIPGLDVRLEYYLVQRKGVPISAACRDFLQLLKEGLLNISGPEKTLKRRVNSGRKAGEKDN